MGKRSTSENTGRAGSLWRGQAQKAVESGSADDQVSGQVFARVDQRFQDVVVAPVLHCRDRHAVKGWLTKIKDGTDPQFEEMDQSGPNLMTQSGDSNPPFP